MQKIRIVSVVGARPNFVKIAPFLKEVEKHKDITNTLVHTGQHYTDYMSDIFFRDFKIRRFIALNVGPLPPVKQIAEISKRFERVLLKEKPDLVVVVGDVNSTRACALCAARLKIKVAHIEAGLRSFDKTMPEEINRIVTDSVSDFLFTTEPSANRNLKREGISRKKIFFVGNIMIDSLIHNIKETRKRKIIKELNLARRQYALLTLHRPSNVDNKYKLKNIVSLLDRLGKIIKVVYPVHPRTIKMLRRFKYWKELEKQPNLILTKPLGYIDFLSLMMESKFVITDSGGIQEETTYLGIPCFTLRKNTERPVTITQGTNTITGEDYARLLRLIRRIPFKKKFKRPKFWDGKTALRITKILLANVRPVQ